MGLIEGHLSITPPIGVPVWDVDPYDAEILKRPEDYYAKLRAKGPFVYIPKYEVLACGRYEETRQVFSDHERFVSSRGVGLTDFKLAKPWRPASLILETDPPEHTRVRRIMAKVLSPKVMRQSAELFSKIAQTLVGQVVAKGEIDAVADLAEIYPTTVFPKIVGLKSISSQALLDYGAMVFDAVGPDNEIRRASLAKAETVVPLILDQCRRENLVSGGIGLDIYAFADDGVITEYEAALLVRSLLSAGVDTTVTGIGNLLWCLAQNPDQYEALKADPTLVRATFEEVLRYTAPVHTFCRTANLDTEVSGVKIVEGTKILCALGAANRDALHWPRAGEFDITRPSQNHLGMGAGIHGCVGQNLARAEVSAVLSEILTHVDKIQPSGTTVWRPGNSIRSLAQLPVRFT